VAKLQSILDPPWTALGPTWICLGFGLDLEKNTSDNAHSLILFLSASQTSITTPFPSADAIQEQFDHSDLTTCRVCSISQD
jgi:hypothetical protein